MLKKDFEELGFNQKTTAVYTTLLRVGSGTAAQIAHESGVQRTTTYDILNSLCEKKLAGITFQEKSRIYYAEPPEQLVQHFQNLSAAANDILPILRVMSEQSKQRPRIKYYEGRTGLHAIHDDFLKTKTKEYFYFGSMANQEEALGREYLEKYIRNRIRKKIWSNALRISGHELNAEYYKSSDENYRRVRLLPITSQDNVGCITLYDGKIAYFSTSGENFGLTIESRELFNLLKMLWDCLWQISSPVKND
jgi:sugar-specific transcriptional regulator TrmB